MTGGHIVIFKQLQIHPLVSPCSGIPVFKRTLPGTRVSKSQNTCVCNCGILAFFNHKTLKLTNNKLTENQPSLEGSKKADILEKDAMKEETNGDHKKTSIKAEDNINASGDSVTLTENKKTDSDGNNPENATIGKSDTDISKSNQPEVTNDSNGNHFEKTVSREQL